MDVKTPVWRLTNAVSDLLVYIGAGAMLAITSIISIDIVLKQVGHSIYILPGLAQTLTVLLVLFGLAGAARKDRHIRIGYFFNKLPEKYKNHYTRLVLLTNFVVVSLVAYAGIIGMILYWDSRTVETGLPASILHGGLVVGSIPLALVYLQKLLSDNPNEGGEKWK